MIDIDRIFDIKSEKEFETLAMEIFYFQAKNNVVYNSYINYLGKNINKINYLEQIPFLPIEFFKSKKVLSLPTQMPENEFTIFMSSGTTGQVRSRHYIYNINVYEKSFLAGFEKFFGNPQQYTFLGLLPSYQEAGSSSLVYMVSKLIELSNDKRSGFFLNKNENLKNILSECSKEHRKVILFGVSYALLQMKEDENLNLENLIVIETGGMKGREKEITREELHLQLENILGTKKIYSEYGMTELLSQAYSMEKGIFKPANTLKILVREINDPFNLISDDLIGGINIIDLANIYSCSFIETKDLGKKSKQSFEIIGRFDNSEVRGCNLLVI